MKAGLPTAKFSEYHFIISKSGYIFSNTDTKRFLKDNNLKLSFL